MNPPKVTDDDYINFIIAALRGAVGNRSRAQAAGKQKRCCARRFHSLALSRILNPTRKRFFREARTQIDFNSGILVLDDSTLEKPYSERNALVYRHWSGRQKAVVAGINLITLLSTDGARCVPIDYRIFDKDTDGKTKNDHFAEMLLSARTSAV